MKNALHRLFCLALCFVMVLGMIPVTASAAQTAEVPVYMATEDGVVCTGTITPAEEVETAATKTKLGKPKNLKWNKAIEWNCDGSQSLTTEYGSIAFTLVKPFDSDHATYRIRLYRNGTKVFETYWGTNNTNKYLSVDLHAEYAFTTGTYYFTVQQIAHDTENYSNSAVVKSEEWKYTKPSSKMAKPNGLKWKWPVSTWNANAGTKYMSEWFYSSTKDGEPYWFHRSWGCLDGTDQPPKFEPGDKLEPGYYYFRVRTLSDDITVKTHSNWTEMVGPYYYDGVDSLKAPTLKASNVASSGKIKLTWNAVKGAEKYQVYRATSKNGTYKRIATTTKTTLTNTSAEAGTKYYYKVRAVSPSGNTKSKYSNIINRTCDLPRPANLKATNISSSGKIKLTWNAVEGAAKYAVYRATSKSGTYTKLGTTTKLSYTNTDAVAGKLYYYKVAAIHTNTSANSAKSTYVSRTCDLAQPAITVKLNDSELPRISWAEIDGAVKYQVYRASSKSGAYSLMGSTSNTYYVNKNAEEGTTYYYKVRAVHSNTSANSSFSSVKSIEIPVKESVEDQETSGAMVWIPVNGGTKYHSNSGCSNMDDPRYVTLSEAQSLGFTACKRCY